MPGMLTGAELPSRPELARPADIELLPNEPIVGEFVSLWIESTKFNGSSKCNSSNAFPKRDQTSVKVYTNTNMVYLIAYTYLLQIPQCR